MFNQQIKETNFPIGGLLPKRETKVESFLNQHPQFDGSGIVIAILDSGVDPGIRSLQKTPKGDVKIIRRYDCTGCGDVPLSKLVEPTDGIILGQTGRKLKIPEGWSNPSNNYRVGIKHVFDLYPKELREKIQKDYKEEWLKRHVPCVSKANRNLVDFEEQHSDTTELSEEDKLIKEDIEAKVEVLNTLKEKFQDPGPIYDCILFNDGTKWLACIDTTEEGNLKLCKLIGEYSVTHEYAPLTEQDQLNYSFNVHNDGELLEIVGLSSTHGTHVASIASGFYENDSDKNGIAPGAQIVSLTICDNRLNAMITGTALTRAIIKIMELSKDKPVVIHSSYGVHSHWSNSSRIGELINEVIDKHRCTWIADVGHHGPALSTVTAPPNTNQDVIIGVGAFVTSEMMTAVHSLRQKLAGMIYTWSSRGPAIDGSFGISICAPGNAISATPSFNYCSSESKECTSIASAYVAGAVALLLSGIVAEQKYFSPHTIKRALENGATVLEDIEPFAQGHGLLEIENSYGILTDPNFSLDHYVRFDISCGSDDNKGIYMFCTETHATEEWSVNIEPKFIEGTAPSEKIEFNLKLILECTAPYINYPKYLNIANMARTISIKVEAENLKPGAYTTNVQAFNIDHINKGPVFRIPVTIIKAQEIDPASYTYTSKKKTFKPNTIKRHFFKVPEKATWAVFELNCMDEVNIGHFVLHTIQILPKKSCSSLETKHEMVISSNTKNVKSFPVKGEFALEVVVAKNWNSLGDMTVQYSISFYGIKPSKPFLNMLAVDGIHRVEVTTLRGEKIQPIVTLNNSVRILDPVESKIKPLTSRDIIPPGRQIYELILTYNFFLVKSTEVFVENPYLSDFLYESEYESQFWMIFDTNKQLLGCGDAYPSKYSIKLERGSYTIKHQIRHDKKEYLDKLNASPTLLVMKLANPINIDVFPTYTDALIGGKKAEHLQQPFPPFAMPLYIGTLSSEKYNTKNNNTADYLTGTITYAKDELGKVDTYPVRYILHRGENNKKTSENKENCKTKLEEYKEALKDLKNTWLKKMDKEQDAEVLFEDVKQEFPDDLQVHINMLRIIHPLDPKARLPAFKEEEIAKYKVVEIQNKVLPLCDEMLKNIDQDSILCYFASKTDPKEDPKTQELMKLKKTALIEFLCHKGIALCCLYQFAQHQTVEYTTSKDDISDVWINLAKFVDLKDKTVDSNVILFAIWHAAVHKHYGRLIKFLLKYQDDKNSREVEEKCIEVCELLGWIHVVKHLRRILPSKYPLDYKPF